MTTLNEALKESFKAKKGGVVVDGSRIMCIYDIYEEGKGYDDAIAINLSLPEVWEHFGIHEAMDEGNIGWASIDSANS